MLARILTALRHPATLLVLITGVAYLPALTTRTFFVRDIMLQYLPSRRFLTSSFADGHFPLWNPLLHGGQTFLANPQNLLTYPPWVLSCLLPLLTGLNVAIVGHLILASLSAYWLGRVLGFSRVASFVVGFGFSFSGVIVSLVNLTHLLFTISWMPMLIASFIRMRERPGPRSLALTALAGGMLILAGGGEMILVSFLTLGVFFVGGSRGDVRRLSRDLTLLVLVVALAASLGAVRIWTTVDYLPETSRGESQSYTEMVRYSVHPHRLPEMLAPGFMGSTNGIETAAYWGRELEGALPYMFSIHFGAGLLVLALLGAASRSGLPGLLRSSLSLLVLGSIALALGEHLPGFELVDGLPLISRFRYPVKILTFAALPVAVLAGAGLDALSRMTVRARRYFALGLGAGAAVFLGAAVSASSTVGRRFWESWFGGALADGDVPLLIASLVTPALALVFLALATGQIRPRWLIVAGVICTELLVGAQKVNSMAPRSVFDAPPHVDEIRRTTEDGFFLRVRGPVRTTVESPENSDRWFARWVIEVYELYTAYLWNVPQVFHSDFDGLAPARIVELGDMVATGDRTFVRRVLEMSGVRSILMNEIVDDPYLRLVGGFRGPSDETLYLYENDGAERARFISEPVFASSRREAEDMLRSNTFNPGVHAVVETSRHEVERCASTALSVDFERRAPDETWTRVSTECSGYLVIAETFLPGWSTRVGDVEVAPVRANFAFTAVWLEPGTHEVIRTYRPRGFTSSLVVSCLSLALLMFFGFRRPRESREVRSDAAGESGRA